jgi:hypothetical protein
MARWVDNYLGRRDGPRAHLTGQPGAMAPQPRGAVAAPSPDSTQQVTAARPARYSPNGLPSRTVNEGGTGRAGPHLTATGCGVTVVRPTTGAGGYTVRAWRNHGENGN